MESSSSIEISNGTASPNKNFIQASPKPELNGGLGLSLHEVATSLEAEFKHVRSKFESYKEEFGMVGVPTVAEYRGMKTTTYILPVDEAKLFVTQYRNKVAVDYCRFLISRDAEFTQAEAKFRKYNIPENFSYYLKQLMVIEFEQNELKKQTVQLAGEIIETNKEVIKTKQTVAEISRTQDDSPLTNIQQKQILLKINDVATSLYGNHKKGSGMILRKLKNKFGLDATRQTYKDLPQSKFNAAINWLDDLDENDTWGEWDQFN